MHQAYITLCHYILSCNNAEYCRFNYHASCRKSVISHGAQIFGVRTPVDDELVENVLKRQSSSRQI